MAWISRLRALFRRDEAFARKLVQLSPYTTLSQLRFRLRLSLNGLR